MKILLIIVVLAPGFSSSQWFNGLSQYQDSSRFVSDPFATSSYSEVSNYNDNQRPRIYGSQSGVRNSYTDYNLGSQSPSSSSSFTSSDSNRFPVVENNYRTSFTPSSPSSSYTSTFDQNFPFSTRTTYSSTIGTRANPNWTQQSVLPVAPTTQRPLSADALTHKSTETVFPSSLSSFKSPGLSTNFQSKEATVRTPSSISTQSETLFPSLESKDIPDTDSTTSTKNVIDLPQNSLPFPLGIEEVEDETAIRVVNDTSNEISTESSFIVLESKEILSNKTFLTHLESEPSSANNQTILNETTTISTVEETSKPDPVPMSVIDEATKREEYKLFLKWLKNGCELEPKPAVRTTNTRNLKLKNKNLNVFQLKQINLPMDDLQTGRSISRVKPINFSGKRKIDGSGVKALQIVKPDPDIGVQTIVVFNKKSQEETRSSSTSTTTSTTTTTTTTTTQSFQPTSIRTVNLRKKLLRTTTPRPISIRSTTLRTTTTPLSTTITLVTPTPVLEQNQKLKLASGPVAKTGRSLPLEDDVETNFDFSLAMFDRSDDYGPDKSSVFWSPKSSISRTMVVTEDENDPNSPSDEIPDFIKFAVPMQQKVKLDKNIDYKPPVSYSRALFF